MPSVPIRFGSFSLLPLFAAPRSARLLARPFVRSLVSSFFGVCLAVQFLFLFFSCCCPSPLANRLLYMSFGSLPLAAQFLFLCCYFNTHVYNKNTKAETRQVKLRWAQQPHSGHACIKKSAISSVYKYINFISFCVFTQHICSTHASYGRGIFSIINFCIFNHCPACLSCSISPSYDVCMYVCTKIHMCVCYLYSLNTCGFTSVLVVCKQKQLISYCCLMLCNIYRLATWLDPTMSSNYRWNPLPSHHCAPPFHHCTRAEWIFACPLPVPLSLKHPQTPA